jgi:predicted RNA-binding Zn ribbon-like protein
VQFNTYTSAGAHIAAALVNDPMTDVAAVGVLLAGFDVEEPVPGEAELADLRDWTARLRSVFEPLAEAERAELVNDLLVESDCRPRLITHDGLPHHLHYRPLAGDLAARVKAFTAAGLAYLIAEGWGSRLGRCQRDGCAVAFVDTSRNGTRRFCSVRCANQVNVSNHRVRRRTAPRRLPQPRGLRPAQPVVPPTPGSGCSTAWSEARRTERPEGRSNSSQPYRANLTIEGVKPR